MSLSRQTEHNCCIVTYVSQYKTSDVESNYPLEMMNLFHLLLSDGYYIDLILFSLKYNVI